MNDSDFGEDKSSRHVYQSEPYFVARKESATPSIGCEIDEAPLNHPIRAVKSKARFVPDLTRAQIIRPPTNNAMPYNQPP